MFRMKMDSVPTFTATIYVGRKNNDSGEIEDYIVALEFLQEYCNINGFCFSFKHIDYIYKGGSEPGIEIGIINYPRFPAENFKLKAIALAVADTLRELLHQKRASVVMPNETIMVS